MGIVIHGALTTLLRSDKNLLMKVPDSWSLQEAATVPIAYGTVLYALKLRGQVKAGESILIHSGLGGVGQAAIRYALHVGLEVFTTVGNDTRKHQLKMIFPDLKDSHIGNSHDTTFKQMIMTATGGRGVDVVLNSLAEDKLIASVECLAKGGRFLEIGRYDMSLNNSLNLVLMDKNCSYHGIMLDKIFESDSSIKGYLCSLILAGIQDGFVHPLNRTVFEAHKVEGAFRYAAAGKHSGKILIEVRPEEEKDYPMKTGMRRYHCKPDKSYIVVGGLGGMGLELINWMVIRGARKFVVSSRTGAKDGYQMRRLRSWRSSGTTIEISTNDVTSIEGCRQLIEEAQKLGPVEAIFNLAMVLREGMFENQTPETFSAAMAPKAYTTKHLDQLSRTMCPNLSDFVVFSTVSCGKGNAGQSNYGMASSVIERICEERRKYRFPGLAIQWGPVADVGTVAHMQQIGTEGSINGHLLQKITSCLEVLDIFLRQKTSAVVASTVVAEKISMVLDKNTPSQTVARILGLFDLDEVSPLATLAELGMDSMTAVEIRHSLQKYFAIILNPKEIRHLTLAKLSELDDTHKYASTI